MSRNPIVAPKNDIPSQQIAPVKKPWPRWLIVIWMLLIFGVLANAVGTLVAQKAGGGLSLARWVAGGLFVLGVWLMFGVVTLRKPLLLTSAVLLGLVAGLVILNSVYLVVQGAALNSVLTVTIVCSVPCLLAAWYLSRRSFLTLAVNYRLWRSQVNG